MPVPDWSSGATVVSVNVGAIREIVFHGEVRTTGIWKSPVAGRVAVGATGLAGDRQADLTVHGGRDKAVYAYAAEDLDWWQRELGVAVAPGTFGENLTLGGANLAGAVLGETWRVGTAVLQIVQPRYPCWKLGVRMGDAAFPARFLAAERSGTYFRVVAPGDVAAGDAVEVLSRPSHAVTVGTVAHLNHADRPAAKRLLEAAIAGLVDDAAGPVDDAATPVDEAAASVDDAAARPLPGLGGPT
ncbi:MAG TPA: MOSC domain-containing protein [Acidimicrobiales bacterium]|nr:MOSC domain-containing protein [Acidimicrobiales bacterium]